ncbi:MAG: class I SAM-dependent methyltransferase [Verrucomicrobiales bacterium]
MTKLETFEEHFSRSPGFFSPFNVVLWDALLEWQHTMNVSGDLLEIGVYEGKSAGILALHAEKDESLYLVDPDEKLQQVCHKLATVCEGKVSPVQDRSDSASVEELARLCGSGIRWIHIDGDHSAAGVTKDMELADRMLSNHGLVCVDDFFSPWYPQITLAVCRFLERNPGRLELVLCGFNKGYLGRPGSHTGELLRFLRDNLVFELEARGMRKVTLFKTDRPNPFNCFGIAPLVPGKRRVGLDEDPDLLPI